jgi:hypothetical protein
MAKVKEWVLGTSDVESPPEQAARLARLRKRALERGDLSAGVPFTEELASRAGMAFVLLPYPEQDADAVERAAALLYLQRDVVLLQVARIPDLCGDPDERFAALRAEYVAWLGDHPRIEDRDALENLLADGDSMSADERAWLTRFVERWDHVEAVQAGEAAEDPRFFAQAAAPPSRPAPPAVVQPLMRWIYEQAEQGIRFASMADARAGFKALGPPASSYASDEDYGAMRATGIDGSPHGEAVRVTINDAFVLLRDGDGQYRIPGGQEDRWTSARVQQDAADHLDASRLAAAVGAEVVIADTRARSPKDCVIPTLAALVARMKDQVVADMEAGRVPRRIASFGDLHDYRDANCYGGLGEERFHGALIEHFGGCDACGGMPDGMLAYINAAQTLVGEWLQDGRPGGPEPRSTRPGEGEVQYFLWDEETESGFIIRAEDVRQDQYKGEEWRNSDIVDVHYGRYAETEAWTEREAAVHVAWRAQAPRGPRAQAGPSV